jgi:hypothetical protein
MSDLGVHSTYANLFGSMSTLISPEKYPNQVGSNRSLFRLALSQHSLYPSYKSLNRIDALPQTLRVVLSGSTTRTSVDRDIEKMYRQTGPEVSSLYKIKNNYWVKKPYCFIFEDRDTRLPTAEEANF